MESGKGKENVKGHIPWLARFDRKFSFYSVPFVSSTGICPVWHKQVVLANHDGDTKENVTNKRFNKKNNGCVRAF